MRKLPKYKHCFICGDENDGGTRMTWVETENGVQGKYSCMKKHSGFEAIIHGGVLSGLLDECVGWAVALKKKRFCFTGELNVRFLMPVAVDSEIVIKGKIADDQPYGKKYFVATGEIVDNDGKVYATCEAKFFPMPKEMDEAVIEKLELPEDSPGRSVREYLWGNSVQKSD